MNGKHPPLLKEEKKKKMKRSARQLSNTGNVPHRVSYGVRWTTASNLSACSLATG